MTNDKAILAGGCFWGMEDLIREQPGVISTVVGYTGGTIKMQLTGIMKIMRKRSQ